MNAVDIWPFIDTLLKVSTGAMLALASIWLYGRQKWLKNPSENNSRRLQLLEEISAAVGNVNHCFAKYSALVIESTRFGSNWPSARKLELERTNEELVREFRNLAEAEAKLLMLGEKTMEKTLRLYGAKIALFRKQVYIGRKDISDQEIAELKGGILALRDKFYELLSRRYDKLLLA